MRNAKQPASDHWSDVEAQEMRPVPAVRFRGLSKRFGPALANDNVSFDIGSGRVVALLGENGAGKSTVMNILAGLYLPDEGVVEIEGLPLRLGSPFASVQAGVGMVHQQFRLVDTLTAFENVSLAIHRGRFLQPATPSPALKKLAGELDFVIAWDQLVRDMTLAHKQQLEIFRILVCGARILVLDEPTSVLAPPEAERLFEIVGGIARSGRSVVLISHKLPEIRAVADDVVVMKSGRVVHSGTNIYRDPASDLDALARLIVGNRLPPSQSRTTTSAGPTILRVNGVSVTDSAGFPVVRDVGFEIRRGEVVALVGVTGNGQTELLDAIAGLRLTSTGTVEAPRDSKGRKFAYIPAQHIGVALAPGLSVAENAILGRQSRPPFGRWFNRHVVAANVRSVTALFGVKARDTDDVGQLSGGNMQRLVLGRELADDPSLIVAAYPTRGLDVASSIEIRNALVSRARAGAAVLFSSEELEESVAIATRILVMHGGRIVAELDPHAVTPEIIGRLMMGGEGGQGDALVA
jgi:simple sugar transport system ATP-binding protein